MLTTSPQPPHTQKCRGLLRRLVLLHSILNQREWSLSQHHLLRWSHSRPQKILVGSTSPVVSTALAMQQVLKTAVQRAGNKKLHRNEWVSWQTTHGSGKIWYKAKAEGWWTRSSRGRMLYQWPPRSTPYLKVPALADSNPAIKVPGRGGSRTLTAHCSQHFRIKQVCTPPSPTLLSYHRSIGYYCGEHYSDIT